MMNENNLLVMIEALNIVAYCEQQKECCRCVFGQHNKHTCVLGEPWRWGVVSIKSQIQKEVGEDKRADNE